MKLIELNPQWMNAGGEGVSQLDPATGAYVPAPLRTGVGILLDCPCGKCLEEHQRLYVPFDVALDGTTGTDRGWHRVGDTFETLTLTPSILRNPHRGGCGWHGFITNGEVISC